MSTNSGEAREFSTTGPVTADVRMGGGDVTVTTDDQNLALVTVTPYDSSEASRRAAEQTIVRFTGDHLTVETHKNSGGIFRRDGRIRVDLRLPVDSRLKAQVSSADIHASGRLMDVNVDTSSGDTYVANATGGLRVNAASGDVRADQVGTLHVRCASGDTAVTTVHGTADVSSASGDIDIDVVAGELRANTASGDISLHLVTGPRVSVNTASGDVRVGVPVGTLAWLDLQTLSGSTSSDLDVNPVAPSSERATLTLRVNTLSGDITVHRAATEHSA